MLDSSCRQNRDNTQRPRFNDDDLVTSDKIHVAPPLRIRLKDLRREWIDSHVSRLNISAIEPEMRIGKRRNALLHDRRADGAALLFCSRLVDRLCRYIADEDQKRCTNNNYRR